MLNEQADERNGRGRAGDGARKSLTCNAAAGTVPVEGALMSALTKRLLISAAILAAIASQALPAEKAATAEPGFDRSVTVIRRVVPREEPIAGDEWYVQTYVLDLVGLQNPSAWRPGKGFPVYKVVQTSEGPMPYSDAAARQREIRDKGLEIGTHFWPISQVQRVEIRPHQPPN